MKIAMILPSLANKGPILVARDLCMEYVAMGINCKVYYFDEIKEVDMPCDTEKISFFRSINFREYDIVHSHMYRPDAYIFFHKPLLKVKTRFITTMHQHIAEQMPFDFNKLKASIIIKTWLLFLNRFDSIVTLSSYHNDYYKNCLNISSEIIYNGRNIDTNKEIDDDDLNKIENLKSKYKIIGGIAYITKRKGYIQLINSLQYLPEYAAIIVGDGPELANLKLAANQYNVSERCLFLGSRIDAYRYFKYLDCFILCSYTEGFPLALVESAAFGIPVVCSDINIFKCLLSKQEAVFFKLENINSLTSSIKYAINNKTELSTNVRLFYTSKLTRRTMSDNYYNLYNRLLKRTYK